MLYQDNSLPFFAGLVVGGVVGVGLTLLLAPQSGEEARSQISAKSYELKDGAVEGLAEAGHRAHAKADAWQEKGHTMTDAINRSKDRIVRAVSQGKDSVVEAVSSKHVG